MRLPGRLRKPISTTALQRYVKRSVEANLVSRRDVKRLDPRPGPDHPPDLFTGIQQRHPAAFCRTGLLVHPTEATLRTTDRRQIKPQPQVTGETQPAGVGNPLRISQDDVGNSFEPGKGLQQDRQFPEGQQAGNIRETAIAARCGRLQHRPPQVIEHHDGSMKQTAPLLVGDINPGNGIQRLGN
mgnify:FL=1